MREQRYIMFRYFAGEKNNPFAEGTNKHRFWFYEAIFERSWANNESSDWYAFFKSYDLERNFMQLLRKEDHDKPSDKAGVFSLWLEYLFTEKLDRTDESLYFNQAVYTEKPYEYYQGEEDCPFDAGSGKVFWWRIERYAFEAGDQKREGELSETMLSYIREKVWQSDSGAPTTSWETGIKRSTELYRLGEWTPVYITDQEARIEATEIGDGPQLEGMFQEKSNFMIGLYFVEVDGSRTFCSRYDTIPEAESAAKDLLVRKGMIGREYVVALCNDLNEEILEIYYVSLTIGGNGIPEFSLVHYFSN